MCQARNLETLEEVAMEDFSVTIKKYNKLIVSQICNTIFIKSKTAYYVPRIISVVTDY